MILGMTPYRCRPHERSGSSGQTSLVAATTQSVRFARSLATRCDAGQPIYIHVFVRPSEWAGNARPRWSLARRTQPTRDGEAFHSDEVHRHRPLTTSFHEMHTLTSIILQTSPCSARFGRRRFLQYVPGGENSIRWVSVISV
jgi:hypothetical protein